MDRKNLSRAGMALGALIILAAVIAGSMDYSSGNSLVPSASTSSSQPGITTTTSFTGGGTIASGTSLNFGGPTGITVQGNQGLWAGSSRLTTAPFSVDLQGNLKASSATISGNITSGSPTGARIFLDPAVGTIDLYDGSNVLAGKVGALRVGSTDVAFLQSATSATSKTLVSWTDGTNSSGMGLNLGLDGGQNTLYSASATSTAQLVLDSDTAALSTNDGTNSALVNLANGTGIGIGGTGTGNKVGFFNASPAAKPVVTGSRGGNAALASLITALATLGLVTDSTTP